jgi:hypothetical protein
MSRTPPIRTTVIARWAVVACCLPLLGCYEEPVRDHLHIAFLPGRAIIVTAVREIDPSGAAGDNTALASRMDQARSDLAAGWDRWGRGFGELEPLADRTTIERNDGELTRGIHSALLDAFRPLERFLGMEGLGAFYDESAGIRELQLVPTGASQATRQQRELVDRRLTAWSEDIASYLTATAALYEYLDRAPTRAVPCFAHVFDRHTDASGPLSEREAELVTAVKETSERVADALVIQNGEAYSSNELSRLVFDSFQGRLTIAVDGPVVDSEGFAVHADFLERPPVDLWRALEAAIGAWLSPDVVTAMVTPGPADAQPEPDPASFAALPRRWAQPPNAATVEAELRQGLKPASVERVRWQARPAPDDEDAEAEQALAALASAETDLPE